ncbi:MAG: NTP transferase domain-containing protein [Eubacterium sp.]|nr:NTP transferase domain-containing protein [Eubacterium sp.]
MAAGTSSRFAPLSYEMPKGLTVVKGEVLIERQLRQLREAGIDEIIVVVGYMKEKFEYLSERFGVILVENKEYLTRNNNSSIMAVRDYLKNSYICSSDNYFSVNPFERETESSYYAAVYAEGKTDEWCMTADGEGYINSVTVGGSRSWYMLGHTFWSEEFSKAFLEILDREYDLPETKGKLWESIFLNHLDVLKMKIKKYPDGVIYEFDSFDELRGFDKSYIDDSRSVILKSISRQLGCKESDIKNISALYKDDNSASGFTFTVFDREYEYSYDEKLIK